MEVSDISKKVSIYEDAMRSLHRSWLHRGHHVDGSETWYEPLRVPLDAIVRSLDCGTVTYTFHEVNDGYVHHKETGPPELESLRTNINPRRERKGRIGSALKSGLPSQIDKDVTIYDDDEDYVVGREDTISELVVIVPGVKGFGTIGVINLETDRFDAFDQVDASYLTFLAAWVGSAANLSQNKEHLYSVVESVVTEVGVPLRDTSDEEQRRALWERMLACLRLIVPFDEAGIVSAVDTISGMRFHIEYLTEGFRLGADKKKKFAENENTVSAQAIISCIDTPNEVYFLSGDLTKGANPRWSSRDYREETDSFIALGVAYDATNRCYLAITLDFDAVLEVHPIQRELCKAVARLTGHLLVQVERNRQLVRQKQLRSASIVVRDELLDPVVCEVVRFANHACAGLLSIIHADHCLLVYERGGSFEVAGYSGSKSGIYWKRLFNNESKPREELIDVLKKREEKYFLKKIQSPTLGSKPLDCLFFARVVSLHRTMLLVSVKDITGRQDVQRVSTGTRELIASYCVQLERSSALRQVRGRIDWMGAALESTLRARFDGMQDLRSLVRAAHGFFDEWRPVASPFGAIYHPAKGGEGEVLEMSKYTHEFLLEQCPPERHSEVTRSPLCLLAGEDGLTARVWKGGALFYETAAKGHSGCQTWWKELTGMSSHERMFAGAKIMAKIDGGRRPIGVLTLNGPPRLVARKYPESVHVILSVVKMVADQLGDSIVRHLQAEGFQ